MQTETDDRLSTEEAEAVARQIIMERDEAQADVAEINPKLLRLEREMVQIEATMRSLTNQHCTCEHSGDAPCGACEVWKGFVHLREDHRGWAQQNEGGGPRD